MQFHSLHITDQDIFIILTQADIIICYVRKGEKLHSAKINKQYKGSEILKKNL